MEVCLLVMFMQLSAARVTPVSMRHTRRRGCVMHVALVLSSMCLMHAQSLSAQARATSSTSSTSSTRSTTDDRAADEPEQLELDPASEAEYGGPGPWGAPFDRWKVRAALTFSGLVAFPNGDPFATWEQWQPGLLIGFRLGVGLIPLVLGVEIYSLFGVEHADTTLSDAAGQNLISSATQRPTTFGGNLLLRLQPPFWQVRPYLEGVVGIQNTFTDYRGRIAGNDVSWSSDSSFTGNVGWGIGLEIYLSKAAALILGLRRQHGPQQLRQQRVQTGDSTTTVAYAPITSMTTITLGFSSRY